MNNFTNVSKDEIEKQGEMMENAYKRQSSKRSGPLEVSQIDLMDDEQFTEDTKDSSKRHHNDSDQSFILFLFVHFKPYLRIPAAEVLHITICPHCIYLCVYCLLCECM